MRQKTGERAGILGWAGLIVLLISPLAPAQTNARIEGRVDELLSQLTPQEKIEMLGGVDSFYTHAIARLKIPRLKMSDGPVGTRNDGPATAFPAGVLLAATWDPAVARQEGEALGHDGRERGDYFLLGPGVNIYRVPQNGRNFEYMGEDPYLAGQMASAYIQGVQSQGVSACVKHFVANNQETDRDNINVTVDERALHEIYLPAFEAAVKQGHVWAVMDAYNCVNGPHMTANEYVDNQVLKKSWGFQGVLMSDWGATHDTLGPAVAGLDLEMPSPLWLNADRLLPLMKTGLVTQAMIDDKVRRLLRVMVAMGWLDRPQSQPVEDRTIDPRGDAAALAAAREGIVLLKNDGDILPLDSNRMHKIVLVGPNADRYVAGGGSSYTQPNHAITLAEGMEANLAGVVALTYVGFPQSDMSRFARMSQYEGDGLTAEYFDTEDLSGAPSVSRTEAHIHYGAKTALQMPAKGPHFSARWIGKIRPDGDGRYVFAVRSEDGSRVKLDGKTIIDDWSIHSARTKSVEMDLKGGQTHDLVVEYFHDRWNTIIDFGWGRMTEPFPAAQQQVAAGADAVVVCVGTDETEGSDRPYDLPEDQVELIQQAARINPHCIVVLNAGGNVGMGEWIDGVPALVDAWFAGQEGGTALADILFGRVNPSGHLPDTFEKKWSDSPAYGNYPGADHQVNYAEGIYVGYRWYDKKQIEPRFPFGFGLSYTKFSIGNLKIAASGAGDDRTFAVSADVTNTGSREGATVAQLYVRPGPGGIDRPVQELKGFARVDLQPGETRTVSMQLDRRSLAYWDVTSHDWKVTPGVYDIAVGQSSREIDCTGALKW